MSDKVAHQRQASDGRQRQVKVIVAMWLATLRHSGQPARPVVRGPREEAGHETHSGLRAPTPLPPGERPAPLSEVAGPQRAALHMATPYPDGADVKALCDR